MFVSNNMSRPLLPDMLALMKSGCLHALHWCDDGAKPNLNQPTLTPCPISHPSHPDLLLLAPSQ